MMSQQTTTQTTAPTQTSPRPGQRFGVVAELSFIAPLKPGGGDQMRAKFQDNSGRFVKAASLIGTLHDMRWVIFDNDTRLFFGTTYDGDWDTYIDDFATKIPDMMDELFSALEGWPGIHSPNIKDWIVERQLTATGWYCAYPEASVKQVLKGQRVLKAFEALLDTAAG